MANFACDGQCDWGSYGSKGVESLNRIESKKVGETEEREVSVWNVAQVLMFPKPMSGAI